MGPLCTDCPVLKSVLFRGLSSEQIARLGCIFRPTRYRRSQILFFEGGVGQHVFALHSGLVKVVKSLENGKDRITRVLFPGELFGLEALAESIYPLTAVTLRDCEICAASRDEFLEFLRANPDVSLGMVRFLVTEVTRVRTQVTDMSFKDARMKVATLLLSLLSSETQTPPETYSLTLPFSRQEISEILELSPETVSRTLSMFRRDQVLEARGRRVAIHDLGKLQAAAHR
ncbi:MAG: Crp/Fnr family transcriptional regulator [Terriglobia bacterium]